MNNVKDALGKIDIPDELQQRSKLGIQRAKKEMQSSKRRLRAVIATAASIVILFGAYQVLQSDTWTGQRGSGSIVLNEDGSIVLPAIKLPKNSLADADMIGLIVYKGKIYTQTDTEIDAESAKRLLGEKLGTTIGNIDEWSKQKAYAIEFASTIGATDVYSVQGYDKGFRIMTYYQYEGVDYYQFYECLNGITVHDGSDVLGKLNMAGRAVGAQFQIHSDWYNSVDRHYPFADKELLNRFVEELNHTVPRLRESVEEQLGDFRNDGNYRRLTIELTDGSRVSIVLIKGGYITYGTSGVYFEMDNVIFAKVWEALKPTD